MTLEGPEGEPEWGFALASKDGRKLGTSHSFSTPDIGSKRLMHEMEFVMKGYVLSFDQYFVAFSKILYSQDSSFWLQMH